MGREKELIREDGGATRHSGDTWHDCSGSPETGSTNRRGTAACIRHFLRYICSGAETRIRTLVEVLGEGGTLVMPTHSSDYSEPDWWEAPPAPKALVFGVIRESTPGYDPNLTPTRGMGRVPELFRHFREVPPLRRVRVLRALRPLRRMRPKRWVRAVL